MVVDAGGHEEMPAGATGLPVKQGEKLGGQLGRSSHQERLPALCAQDARALERHAQRAVARSALEQLAEEGALAVLLLNELAHLCGVLLLSGKSGKAEGRGPRRACERRKTSWQGACGTISSCRRGVTASRRASGTSRSRNAHSSGEGPQRLLSTLQRSRRSLCGITALTQVCSASARVQRRLAREEQTLLCRAFG